MKKTLSVLIITALISALFSGCSLKNTKSAEEMPDDKPWNREIMETDNGYYYNYCDFIHSMRYSEKSNYTDIFLCAKPECSHDGEDTCAATFNFLESTNHVLYDGAVYFASEGYEKDSLSYSLYKESLDGTTLDKLCDICKVKYPSAELNGWGFIDDIIIHRGYAYVPYDMGHSNTYSNFVECGLAKVNIGTGKVEKIFSTNDYAKAAKIYLYAGLGDYVYYRSESTVSSQNGFFKYNVNDGSIEKIECEFGEKLCDSLEFRFSGSKDDFYLLTGITEKTFYVTYKKGNTNKLTGYDAKTLEPNGFELDMPVDGEFYARAACYDDKIFVFDLDEIKVYSDKGEQTGSHKWQTYLCGEDETTEFIYDDRKFDFSDGKLYTMYLKRPNSRFDSSEYESDSSDEDDFYWIWYSCPVDDIIAGTGKWKKAYKIEANDDYWKEYPTPKYVEKYIISKWEEEGMIEH